MLSRVGNVNSGRNFENRVSRSDFSNQNENNNENFTRSEFSRQNNNNRDFTRSDCPVADSLQRLIGVLGDAFSSAREFGANSSYSNRAITK